MADPVYITHPDTEGVGVVSQEQFDVVYEPKGWTVTDEAAYVAHQDRLAAEDEDHRNAELARLEAGEDMTGVFEQARQAGAVGFEQSGDRAPVVLGAEGSTDDDS